MNLGSILLKKAQARAKRERRERREIWRAEREARYAAYKPDMLVAKALVILHQRLNFMPEVARELDAIGLPVTYTVQPGPTLTINTQQEE